MMQVKFLIHLLNRFLNLSWTSPGKHYASKTLELFRIFLIVLIYWWLSIEHQMQSELAWMANRATEEMIYHMLMKMSIDPACHSSMLNVRRPNIKEQSSFHKKNNINSQA